MPEPPNPHHPAHGPASPPGPAHPLNQCDGCRRGLHIEGNIHYDKGRPYMCCTRDRYQPPPMPNPVKGLKLSLYPIIKEH